MRTVRAGALQLQQFVVLSAALEWVQDIRVRLTANCSSIAQVNEMMPKFAAFAALLALLFVQVGHARPLFEHHAESAVFRELIGTWRLEVSRSAFSESVACSLRSADYRTFYANGAVASKSHLGDAFHRLDGTAPQRSCDDQPRPPAQRVPIDRGGMDNVSADVVWIPFDLLAEAGQVSIQPRRDRRPHAFDLRGVQALYTIAIAQGCAPDGRFAEQ